MYFYGLTISQYINVLKIVAISALFFTLFKDIYQNTIIIIESYGVTFCSLDVFYGIILLCHSPVPA